MPGAFAAARDLHAGIDDAVFDFGALLEWAERDERDGKDTPPEPDEIEPESPHRAPLRTDHADAGQPHQRRHRDRSRTTSTPPPSTARSRRWPTTPATSCSSSTPRASAASPRSSAGWSSSTRPTATRASPSSASRATSSAARTPAPRRRSATSARRTTASPSRCSPRSTSTATTSHPLYTWLKSEKGGLLGDKIKWNFTKFLVGRDGTVIGRYAPPTEPQTSPSDIEKALATERR